MRCVKIVVVDSSISDDKKWRMRHWGDGAIRAEESVEGLCLGLRVGVFSKNGGKRTASEWVCRGRSEMAVALPPRQLLESIVRRAVSDHGRTDLASCAPDGDDLLCG